MYEYVNAANTLRVVGGSTGCRNPQGGGLPVPDAVGWLHDQCRPGNVCVVTGGRVVSLISRAVLVFTGYVQTLDLFYMPSIC